LNKKQRKYIGYLKREIIFIKISLLVKLDRRREKEELKQ